CRPFGLSTISSPSTTIPISASMPWWRPVAPPGTNVRTVTRTDGLSSTTWLSGSCAHPAAGASVAARTASTTSAIFMSALSPPDSIDSVAPHGLDRRRGLAQRGGEVGQVLHGQVQRGGHFPDRPLHDRRQVPGLDVGDRLPADPEQPHAQGAAVEVEVDALG